MAGASKIRLTLWKLVQNESAYLLMFSNCAISESRYSGHARVTPAQAASTCSQVEGWPFTKVQSCETSR